jgi:hypothetical protein
MNLGLFCAVSQKKIIRTEFTDRTPLRCATEGEAENARKIFMLIGEHVLCLLREFCVFRAKKIFIK